MSDDLVVGLDIGTSKVCAIIAEINESGALEITGVGVSPSTGLRKGVVVNIEAVIGSVTAAIEAAEMMSGRVVENCWVSIGGGHIESLISHGQASVLTVRNNQREVGRDDIERALEIAKALKFGTDRQILDVIPQVYSLDGQPGIRNPLGMIGVRIECDANIVTCSITSAQNLVKCVNRAGFHVEGLILQTLAAGRAVLTQEEKDLGCALIDLGGGTTNMLVYHQGAACVTASVPAGGAQVSADISIVKNVSAETAEKIKIEDGCCWDALLEPGDDIIVPGMGGRSPFPVPRAEICAIIRARMEEIFLMVKEKLAHLTGGKPLGAGIILTGGGAKLLGAADMASSIFHMPVRVGVPLPVPGITGEFRDSLYAAAVGLVLEARDRTADRGASAGSAPAPVEKTREPFFGIFSKLRNWIRNEFF
ncbi:MAG: cell division protein FtsA [Spirochaetaceae bacterium]|jgi:cell division protein FtsA|nr:cell division protein FtsA [Spirochaetaceae bacterium]